MKDHRIHLPSQLGRDSDNGDDDDHKRKRKSSGAKPTSKIDASKAAPPLSSFAFANEKGQRDAMQIQGVFWVFFLRWGRVLSVLELCL